MISRRNVLKTICRVTAIGLWCCGVVPACADELPSAWDLTPRDRFVANLTITKHTQVTIGDEPATSSVTRDQLEIEYTVAENAGPDDSLVVARILSATRETMAGSQASLESSSSAVQSLEDATVVLHLDSEGQVTRINPSDRESIFAGLLNMDASALSQLQDACPDEVIGDWFGRVFWIASAKDKILKGEAWKRKHNIALGAFGILRATAEFTPEKKRDEFRGVLIKGTGEYAPLVVPDSRTSKRTLLLRDLNVELDEYAGKARISTGLPTGAEQMELPPPGPASGSMEVTIRFHGEGTTSAATPQKVKFRQTQIQTWMLLKPTSALGNFHFDIPIPREELK